MSAHDNVYGFSFTSIKGGTPLPLSQFKDQVLLIVNTASQCGFTPQYQELQKLYEQYQAQGLVVLGIPCNDFGKQEPGESQDIARFCEINYGVTFPITQKEIVKGEHAHPFYAWAKKTLGFGTAPKWNFHKYLINRQGQLVDYFNSPTKPGSKRLIAAVEKLLSTP